MLHLLSLINSEIFLNNKNAKNKFPQPWPYDPTELTCIQILICHLVRYDFAAILIWFSVFHHVFAEFVGGFLPIWCDLQLKRPQTAKFTSWWSTTFWSCLWVDLKFHKLRALTTYMDHELHIKKLTKLALDYFK